LKIKVKYLSNGPKVSGGYYHEKFWFDKIVEFYQSKGLEVQSDAIRPEVYHTGFWGIISWFVFLFRNSACHHIITPGRCALPILIRNYFSKQKVWVVFHSINTDALKEKRNLAAYYTIIFKLIKWKKSAKIVVVSDFWIEYFENQLRLGKGKAVKLPNLFNPEEFEPYKAKIKDKSIHLGLWSSKLDKSIYELAAHLSHKGFHCFFTSPIDLVSFGSYGYDIVYCDTYETYKRRVASAEYTLTFSRIPEGWSRVSHESFLLSTPVIGSDNSGLGDLLREANGFIANSVSEALEIIDIKPNWKLSEKFVEKYHIKKALQVLEQNLK
jgi:glycosyltransferase involved in cell wall biosynthesis